MGRKREGKAPPAGGEYQESVEMAAKFPLLLGVLLVTLLIVSQDVAHVAEQTMPAQRPDGYGGYGPGYLGGYNNNGGGGGGQNGGGGSGYP